MIIPPLTCIPKSEGDGQEVSTAGGAVEVAESISLDSKNLTMSKQDRSKLRESLRNGIQELKEKELIEKLKASDPLLG